jgi:oxygen tolerance protein BatD
MVNINIRKTILLILSLTLSLVSVSALAATITVTTDRTSVGLNESFAMVFESSGSVDDDPDFSPLNKDFQILSRNTSSNMSIVNGKISSTKKWQLSVLARRAGNIPIPPVSFGRDRSQASSINVSKGRTSASKSKNNQDIFIEVEAEPLSPYVQSEVIYTVRLFLSVATSNASLSEPGISGANAVIERLGEDSNFQTNRKGRRYNVVERRYAIYPQVSGSMTIEPVMFQGQINRNAFSRFDPFGPQPKTLVERSQPITLEVQSVAKQFPSGHWIPAKKLTLTESWSQDPPQFQVGEPLTRTLTLMAEGQTASQLLELPEWVPDAFKQYPDQAVLSDSKSDKGITATRQEKVAIIPNQAGEFVLPEISVPWWNTITNTLEYARVPERKITVAPLSNNSATGLPTMPTLDAPVNVTEENSDPVLDTDTKNEPVSTSTFWQTLSGGLALAWLLTLLLWWRSRKETKGEIVQDDKSIRLKQVLKEVEEACKANQTDELKQALLLWGQCIWSDSPPTSLGEIGKRTPSELAERIELLNNHLYSKKKESWDGDSFWQVFKKSHALTDQKTKEQTGKLEPLYRL